jgi:hypothetical protein
MAVSSRYYQLIVVNDNEPGENKILEQRGKERSHPPKR